MPNKIPSPNDQLLRLGFWKLGFGWALVIGIWGFVRLISNLGFINFAYNFCHDIIIINFIRSLTLKIMVSKNINKKTKNVKKVTEETTLAEILQRAGAEEILAEYELPCLSCPFAKMEMEQLKIGDLCRQYGIDCKNLLKDLNK